MGRSRYPGERRKDSGKMEKSPEKNSSGSYPLNVGSVLQEGYTEIDITEGDSWWRIRNDRLMLLPHDIVVGLFDLDDEYTPWEDTGFYYEPDWTIKVKNNGWGCTPYWATKLEVYSTQKETKAIYRCIFTGDGKRTEIEKCFPGKRAR